MSATFRSVVLLGSLLLAGAARAQPAAPDDARRLIANCFGGAAIELRIGDNSVVLDAADREQVQFAMLRRYPMLAGQGFAPTDIVLWQKPGADWIYVALQADAERPGQSCFAATFAATIFAITPVLQQKYFFAARSRT